MSSRKCFTCKNVKENKNVCRESRLTFFVVFLAKCTGTWNSCFTCLFIPELCVIRTSTDG